MEDPVTMVSQAIYQKPHVACCPRGLLTATQLNHVKLVNKQIQKLLIFHILSKIQQYQSLS